MKINLECFIFLTLCHPRTSHVTLNCSHVRKYLMVLFAHFQRTDSVIPKPVGSLLTATPVLTIKVANNDETGSRWYAKGKEPDADSKHGAYNHTTPKGKVQIEKQAGLEIWAPVCHCMWLAECFVLISFSTKIHSGATLVGMANWATTCLWKFSSPKSTLKQFSKAFSCKVSPLYGVFF